MIIIMNHEYPLLELAHLLGYLDGFFFGAEVPVRFIRITSDDLPTSTGAGHDVMFYSTHKTLLSVRHTLIVGPGEKFATMISARNELF